MSQATTDPVTSFARRVTSTMTGQPEDDEMVILAADQLLKNPDLRDFAAGIAGHLAKQSQAHQESDDDSVTPR
jgi:hypothetical protein